MKNRFDGYFTQITHRNAANRPHDSNACFKKFYLFEQWKMLYASLCDWRPFNNFIYFVVSLQMHRIIIFNSLCQMLLYQHSANTIRMIVIMDEKNIWKMNKHKKKFSLKHIHRNVQFASFSEIEIFVFLLICTSNNNSWWMESREKRKKTTYPMKCGRRKSWVTVYECTGTSHR